MAYTPTFSFTGFQSVNPNRPLPGSDLDVNLAEIAAALAEVRAQVDDVRRADGRLQNDVVTWDALSDDVKNQVNGYRAPAVVVEGGGTLQLSDVVYPDLNPNSFATQIEAETGVANDRLVTPLRAKQAIDAQRPLASQAQAQAGTDAVAVMTPARAKDHLDAQRPFSTVAQAQGGADTASVLSPARGKALLDALRAKSSATVSLTWGAVAAGADATQTVTVPGATVGNPVVVGLPASGAPAGFALVAWVSAADTVKIRFTNTTAASATPYAGAATSFTVTALGF